MVNNGSEGNPTNLLWFFGFPLHPQLPDPEQYLVYQQALASDVALALRELARDSLCHALISAFHPVHSSPAVTAGATATSYAAAPPTAGITAAGSSASSGAGTTLLDPILRRQLIRFNVMLRSNLLSFVIDSANEWKKYMLSAVKEKIGSNVGYKIQQNSLTHPVTALTAGMSVKSTAPYKESASCLAHLNIVIMHGSAVFQPSPEKQVKPQVVA